MKKNNFIPNPNKISSKEQNFVEGKTKSFINHNEKEKYKGRMISMSDSFFKKLNNFLKNNPTEGNRSSFIVRVVDTYMEKKEKSIQ